MKKLAMNRHGSIDIGGYVEYMSNLGKMARLGIQYTPEELISGNPWKVEKPEVEFADVTTESLKGKSTFRVIRPYEDLKLEKATPEMSE